MSDNLHDQLSPVLAGLGLELYDVEVRPGTVRVVVDRPGGIDLDGLAEANRTVSEAMDQIDPVPGRYVLEVSSPGVERRLRTPAHFAGALGETVSVRTVPGSGDARRLTGVLAAADGSGFTLDGPEVPGGTARLTYEEVDRARTVFSWGPKPAPSPSRAKAKGSGARGSRRAETERVTTP
jgi:ribosome maturation factor RimP